mmetsp:Transcript_2200/g.5131  ORF Transcript_2200/g.5131 Transcript_2200/m.5131 type:complete len:340 (+) Transcript_2200:59-1078(+)
MDIGTLVLWTGADQDVPRQSIGIVKKSYAGMSAVRWNFAATQGPEEDDRIYMDSKVQPTTYNMRTASLRKLVAGHLVTYNGDDTTIPKRNVGKVVQVFLTGMVRVQYPQAVRDVPFLWLEYVDIKTALRTHMGDSAPFLEQYFELLCEDVQAFPVDAVFGIKMLSDTELLWSAKKAAAGLSRHLGHLISMTFQCYDRAGHNCLSPKEAQSFVECYLTAQSSHLETLLRFLLKQKLMLLAEEAAGRVCPLGTKEKNKLREKIRSIVDGATRDFDNIRDGQDIERSTRAALRFLDMAGDGTLELSDVLAALVPEGSRYLDLIETLGLVPRGYFWDAPNSQG